MRRGAYILAALVCFAWMTGCGGRRGLPETEQPVGSRGVLTLAWTESQPVEALRTLVRAYETQSLVRVQIAAYPDADYHDQIILHFEQRYTQFDLYAIMSHWRAAHVRNRYALDISDFLKREVSLTGVPPALRAISGEYPPGSALYVAAPFFPNPLIFLYRKDWFEDPAEQRAFEQQTGRPLAAPATWEHTFEVARFFQRPDENRYGISVPLSRDFRGLIYVWPHLLMAHGGQLADPDIYRVRGHIDSEHARAALNDLKTLLTLSPPGAAEATQERALLQFLQGQTAMAIAPYSLARGIKRTMGDDVGFAPLPAGPGGHAALIPGFGIAVSNQLPLEQEELALDFLRWFMQRDTQAQWMTLSGAAIYEEHLASDAFYEASAAPEAYHHALEHGQTLWDVYVYLECMRLIQQHVGDALDGYKPVDKALADLADEASSLLRGEGLLKEF